MSTNIDIQFIDDASLTCCEKCVGKSIMFNHQTCGFHRNIPAQKLHKNKSFRRIMGNNEEESQFLNAKLFLSASDTKNQLNVLDHIRESLVNLLTERPLKCLDAYDLNEIHGINRTFSQHNEYLKYIKFVEPIRNLFLHSLSSANDPDGDTNLEVEYPNLLEQSSNFEQVGVGMNKIEYFHLWISIKKLIDTNPHLQSVRYWGKIFGIHKNYYVIECDMKYDEDDEADMKEDDDELADNDVTKLEGDNDEVTIQLDVIPKIKFDKQVIPKEDVGSGTNKKTYFVSNAIGQDWIQLPNVTPAQINYARLIKKFFTGNLESRVQSSPPFFEKEINYLRAQIARISASTDISPVGYFHFDEDDDDDMSNKQIIMVNTEFEALTLKELTDISLINWVHHSPYILTQGRTVWWNPIKNVDEDNEDAEENEAQGIEPEIGPPLLTPLSEDVSVNNVVPWITRKSTLFINQHAIPSIHSNLWRGAHAYSLAKNFENIYFGWGLKHTGRDTEVFHPHTLMSEFVDGPQNSEMDDPPPQNEGLMNDDKKDLNESGKDKSEDNEDSNGNQDDENDPIDE